MEYKINELSLSEKEIEVTLAYDDIKNDIESEVKKQSKNIQLPGFRKGKVPVSVLKKMYGDALEYEASEKVANNQFWEIAKEKHLHPIGQPTMTDIKFNPGENLQFKVKYETMPELEVKEYTDHEIEVPDFQVKDEEVESEVQYILKANSTNEPADQVGDDKNYILDVEVLRVNDKDEPFDGAKPEKLQIDLTNERVQPEIVENAKGKKTGESFNFTFKDERTVKNDKGEEEKVSEDFVYKADIKEIKKIVAPELNEELIKKVTKDKVSTEEELREQIKKDIQSYYDQKVDELLRDRLINAIVSKNEFTPPSTLVMNVLEDMVKREEEEVKKQGYGKFNKAEAEEKFRKYAELEVKWYLIKNAIAKKEEISVSDDDLKELAEKDAEKTGIAVDKLINYYKSSNYGEKLIDGKLFDLLKEKNNIKKVDPEKFSQKKDEEK